MRFLSILLLVFSCHVKINSDKVSVTVTEIFICPRHADRDPFNNHIYQYNLTHYSVLVPFESRSYETKIKADSVFEQQYLRVNWDEKFFKELTGRLVKKSDTITQTPDILIVCQTGKSNVLCDSIWITNAADIQIHGKTYFMDSTLLNKVYEVMSPDLRSNWKNNLPGRMYGLDHLVFPPKE